MPGLLEEVTKKVNRPVPELPLADDTELVLKSARGGSQRRSRIKGARPSFHLADAPSIDIEIPQKGNASHDVKGNSPIEPLNDVLALANRHHQAWGPQASRCIERDYAANQAMEESHDHFTKRRTSH